MGKQVLVPLRDYVYILPDEAADKLTVAGLIIPASVQKFDTKKGVVMSVGPGKSDEPMVLKVGDQVSFGINVGQKVEWQGRTILLMRQHEVWDYLGEEEAAE
jgi:chaperonin GroES